MHHRYEEANPEEVPLKHLHKPLHRLLKSKTLSASYSRMPMFLRTANIRRVLLRQCHMVLRPLLTQEDGCTRVTSSVPAKLVPALTHCSAQTLCSLCMPACIYQQEPDAKLVQGFFKNGGFGSLQVWFSVHWRSAYTS